MSDDAEKLRGFTSWKLDILNAMSVDKEVTDLDFRVAFRIMQHINSVSRIAWPSVARLSAQLDKSEDRIRAATRRLQQVGWIVKGRKSQKAPNEYAFLNDRVANVLDRMQDRILIIEKEPDDHAEMHGQGQDDRADYQFDHAEMHGQGQDDRADYQFDHAEMHGPDHADLHGKHLNQNYLHKTPYLKGSEASKVSTPPSGLTYGDLTKGDDLIPFAPPENEDEAEDMVMTWLEGQPRAVVLDLFDIIRRRLVSGELTPAELRNLIGRAAA